MQFHILTLFPDFFTSPLKASILGKAQENKYINIDVYNIRDFANNKHNKVDEPPYGGGSGMLMQAEPIAKAIESITLKDDGINKNTDIIYFSPSGTPLTQELAYQFAQNKTDKVLLCGHYEGVDQRVLDSHVTHHINIGNAVLTGGEIPALYFLDSVARLIPEVIGKEDSHLEETFSTRLYGKGEYPQFTRPENWRGQNVPHVLLSGDHSKIEDWKFDNLKGLNPTERKIIDLRRNLFLAHHPKKYRNFYFRVPIFSDIDEWMNWFNDEEVCKYTLQSACVTREYEENYYTWQHNNLQLLMLQIIDKKTKKNIGTVSLECDESGRKARFGLIIGNKEFWNKGFGTHVTREMCSIGFEKLGLEKITLDVFPENTAAIKIYKKVGFQKIGTSKKAVFKNREWFDEVLYELLREDYLG